MKREEGMQAYTCQIVVGRSDEGKLVRETRKKTKKEEEKKVYDMLVEDRVCVTNLLVWIHNAHLVSHFV
jgi:hypothetical protein